MLEFFSGAATEDNRYLIVYNEFAQTKFMGIHAKHRTSSILVVCNSEKWP